jgi:hypothetical protein
MLRHFVAIVATLSLVTPGARATDGDADGIDDSSKIESGSQTTLGGLPAAGSLLFDRSHGGFIDMGDFAEYLTNQGWTFTERAEGEITSEVLQGIDILLLPPGMYFSFTINELSTISFFLDRGGGLWMLSDYLYGASRANQIAEPLGVTFHSDIIQGAGLWPDVIDIRSHPVTEGVTEFTCYAGCCLEAEAPAVLVGRTGGHSLYCPERPGALAVWESGPGRAVFQNDSTPFHSSYFPENLTVQHLRLLDNMLIWLLGTAPIAVEQSSWGNIKTNYGGR